MIYIGVGIFGRLGVLDVIELIFIYGVLLEWVFGILVGGIEVMYMVIEGVEDFEELVVSDLEKVKLDKVDIFIVIVVSGRMFYVLFVLIYGNKVGVLMILIICMVYNVML